MKGKRLRRMTVWDVKLGDHIPKIFFFIFIFHIPLKTFPCVLI